MPPNYKTSSQSDLAANKADPSDFPFLAILKAAGRRKAQISLLLLVSMAGAAWLHYYRPMYRSSAALFVRRPENSLIQTFSGSLGEASRQSFGASDKYLDRYLTYFSTHKFMLDTAKELVDHIDSAPMRDKPGLRGKLLNRFGSRPQNSTHNSTPPAIPSLQDWIGLESLLEDGYLNSVAGVLSSSVRIIERAKDTVGITVTAADPEIAVFLSNFLLVQIASTIVSSDAQELNDTKSYLNTQFDTLSKEVKAFEDELLNHKREALTTLANGGGQNAASEINRLRIDLQQTLLKIQQNKLLVVNLMKAGIEPSTLGGMAARDARFEAPLIRQQIEGIRKQRSLMLIQGYSTASDELRGMDQQIDELEKRETKIRQSGESQAWDGSSHSTSISEITASQSLELLKEENQSLQARVEAIQTLLKGISDDQKAMPESEQKVFDLDKKINLIYGMASSLQKKTFEIDLQRVSLKSKVKIIEPASLLQVQLKVSLTTQLTLSALLALAAGTAVAFILEALNKTIKSKDDLTLLGLPLLGALPEVERSRYPNRKGKPFILSQSGNIETPEVMAFKQMRAVLQRSSRSDRPLKVLCIVSPDMGDGKSFVTTNLAISLSKLGKSTLLIDCDSRRPSIPDAFDYSNAVGMTSIITGQDRLENCLIKSSFPHLDILPSGPHIENLSELITSDEFRALMTRVRSAYDFVVLDCPPVLPVVDGTLLATLADATLLITSFRRTTQADVAEAISRLCQASDNPIFGVINRFDEYQRGRSSKHGYGYGYGYGYKYSGETPSHGTSLIPPVFRQGASSATSAATDSKDIENKPIDIRKIKNG